MNNDGIVRKLGTTTDFILWLGLIHSGLWLVIGGEGTEDLWLYPTILVSGMVVIVTLRKWEENVWVTRVRWVIRLLLLSQVGLMTYFQVLWGLFTGIG